jgi:STE24 endopeptidase
MARRERDSLLRTIVRPKALRFFSAEEVARARRYHRPLYWAAAVDLAVAAGVLAAFVWSGMGNAFDPGSLPWWGRAPAFAAIVVAVSAAVRTPLALWRGFVREQRWGLSTQRLPSWAADRCKAAAVNVVLTSALLLGLVALVRVLPGWWAAPAAGAFALATLVLAFLGPVLFEPLFATHRCKTRRSPRSCAHSQSGQASPYATCLSRMRAVAPGKRTPTCQG